MEIALDWWVLPLLITFLCWHLLLTFNPLRADTIQDKEFTNIIMITRALAAAFVSLLSWFVWALSKLYIL